LQAAPREGLVEARTAFMRYRGQGHEIAVPITAGIGAEALQEAFTAAYRGIFGRAIPGLQPEVMTWALALSRPVAPPARLGETGAHAAPPPAQSRALVDPATGLTGTAAIHVRDALTPGSTLQGPALIIEDETTTVVPAGWSASINAAEQIVLEFAA